MRSDTRVIVSLIVAAVSWSPAFAATQQACSEYATSAVKDFKVGTNESNARKCHIKPDARWQADYRAHYNWCLTVPNDAWRSEQRIRDKYLLNCGAISTY